MAIPMTVDGYRDHARDRAAREKAAMRDLMEEQRRFPFRIPSAEELEAFYAEKAAMNSLENGGTFAAPSEGEVGRKSEKDAAV